MRRVGLVLDVSLRMNFCKIGILGIVGSLVRNNVGFLSVKEPPEFLLDEFDFELRSRLNSDMVAEEQEDFLDELPETYEKHVDAVEIGYVLMDVEEDGKIATYNVLVLSDFLQDG